MMSKLTSYVFPSVIIHLLWWMTTVLMTLDEFLLLAQST